MEDLRVCVADKTCGRRPVLNTEFWINVFNMFADGRGADPENRADLGIGFPARASQASASRSRGLMTCNSRGARSSYSYEIPKHLRCHDSVGVRRLGNACIGPGSGGG